ncbi:MAG: nitrilase-related carbon-nitrogen hydrolase [Campylobacterota bacterium]|nr:nitrilase-related carbon-nitrogen hydrolase [Campylobacterota bacterium]
MKVTLVQFAPKLNRSNLEYVCSVIRDNINKSDLIVFPELSLNGYLLQDKLYEDAFELSELSELFELSEKIDIAIGVAMKDDGLFRNSALYFSDGKLLSKHFKVHLPNYGMFEEARYFEAGNVFDSFGSKFGKISMLICEDLWHDSVHENLKKENPDYIIALVASPARGFNDDGLEIENKWYKIIKTVASESNAKLIFVNRIGFEDGLGFWGGSCIVDEKSNIIEKLAHYKQDIKTFKI